MNETFAQWLLNQVEKEALVLLPKHKDLVFKVPEDRQVVNTSTKVIDCNKCPSGSTTMNVFTKEISFTIEDGTVLSPLSLEGYTDLEQETLFYLVEQDFILPRYRRTEDDTLEQLQLNGEYITDFGTVVK